GARRVIRGSRTAGASRTSRCRTLRSSCRRLPRRDIPVLTYDPGRWTTGFEGDESIADRVAVQLAPLHEQLLLVGLWPPERAVQEWRQLGSTIDVATLTDRRAIKLLPLVWRALVDAGVEDPQLPALEAIVHRVRAANALLVERLRSALEVLRAADVPTLA